MVHVFCKGAIARRNMFFFFFRSLLSVLSLCLCCAAKYALFENQHVVTGVKSSCGRVCVLKLLQEVVNITRFHIAVTTINMQSFDDSTGAGDVWLLQKRKRVQNKTQCLWYICLLWGYTGRKKV